MRKLVFVCIYLSLTIPCAADIIYVDNDADGFSDGSTWADAYTLLQDALDDAANGDDIYVAAGTYYPTSDHGLDIGDRGKHFRMKNGVAIYGGFPNEGSDFQNRNPNQYQTILSGDIGVDGETSDNCYHVFYHPDGLALDPNAILDGFTVTAGNADESYPSPHCKGGGMYNYQSSPTVTKCTFNGNSADRGGGMYNRTNSNPEVTDCTFTDNLATHGGGMINREGSSPTVTGCTFTGNSASSEGGGMWNYDDSSPKVTNCTFSDNLADKVYGGGMCNGYNSSPTVDNCIFTTNSALWKGGGMYNSSGSSSKVTNSTFTFNSAYNGGGMSNVENTPTVTNCTFIDNWADSAGGGMDNSGSDPIVTGCTFIGNSALYGGGMHNSQSILTVTNSTFTANLAKYRGGGMSSNLSSLTVINCSFTDNSAYWWGSGGGIHNMNSSSTVTNCTFTGNSAYRGGGLISWYKSNTTLTNCIFWSNTASKGNGIALEDRSTINVDYCDIQGGLDAIYDDHDRTIINWGSGNIDDNPLFADPNNGDFHLSPGSPCIDAGDPDYIADPNVTDLDGNPRVIGGRIDMGAYEFLSPALEAQMKLTPQTLNCSSNGNWIKAHFVLPEEVTIEDVDIDTPAVIDPLGITSAQIDVFINDDGFVAVDIAFDRSEVCSSGIYGNIELTVKGFFTDGTSFHGTDTIRITTDQWETLPEFLSYWLRTDCTRPHFCDGFDIDRNGIVDLVDFVLLGEK